MFSGDGLAVDVNKGTSERTKELVAGDLDLYAFCKFLKVFFPKLNKANC